MDDGNWLGRNRGSGGFDNPLENQLMVIEVKRRASDGIADNNAFKIYKYRVIHGIPGNEEMDSQLGRLLERQRQDDLRRCNDPSRLAFEKIGYEEWPGVEHTWREIRTERRQGVVQFFSGVVREQSNRYGLEINDEQVDSLTQYMINEIVGTREITEARLREVVAERRLDHERMRWYDADPLTKLFWWMQGKRRPGYNIQ